MANFIVRNIPNTITSCNLFSGCIACFQAFQGNYELALTFIILGAVFDFFDGMTARLLHVSSPIGKELDSLADDITFGLAPSAIVFSLFKEIHYPAFMASWSEIMPYTAFLIAVFSASAWPSSILTNGRPARSSVCRPCQRTVLGLTGSRCTRFSGI